MSGIRLSEKHVVNPAIPKCYFCMEDKNMIVLPGKLPGDAEAPRDVVWDMEPCDKCQSYMEQGIIIISTKDGESDRLVDEQAARANLSPRERRLPSNFPNPYRTGGWWVITEEAFRRVMIDGLGVPEKTIEKMIAQRWCFLDDKVCERVGLTDVPPNASDGS